MAKVFLKLEDQPDGTVAVTLASNPELPNEDELKAGKATPAQSIGATLYVQTVQALNGEAPQQDAEQVSQAQQEALAAMDNQDDGGQDFMAELDTSTPPEPARQPTKTPRKKVKLRKSLRRKP